MPSSLKIFPIIIFFLFLNRGAFAEAQAAAVESGGDKHFEQSQRRQLFEISAQNPIFQQSSREPVAADWLIEKSSHFVVKYQLTADLEWVKALLRRFFIWKAPHL